MLDSKEYVKVASYEGEKGKVKKAVLLYSGGLDTSVLLKWIQEEYGAEVIALTIDIGQMTDDLNKIKQKAINLGAKKALVIDAKDEFANEYLAKGIKANANYQQGYHLATALGRPLIAKWAVKIAMQEGADAIAHGCTGKGNDQVRIEGTALALNPDIKIIAPVREWGMGRDEEIEYAKKHKIPVKNTKDKPYSYDDNMWGVSAEGGEIENPALIPPLEKILVVNKLPQDAPLKPENLQLEFVKGIPISLNGKQMKLSELIITLNKIGATHGVGTNIHIEDRVVGLKIRDIFEAPAAEIIISAHQKLEHYVSTRDENEFKKIVDHKWAYLCYDGKWYEPLMKDINAFINSVNTKVTGKATLRLYKGVVEVVSLETPNTIFEEKLATFMASKAFNQNAAAGFIELFTLQMRLAQRAEKTALLSIGKRQNKARLLGTIKKLHDIKYKLYATYKTHKFLKSNGIESIAVNKISRPALKPNLADLLNADRFDLIVNIPDDSKAVNVDSKVIRKKAIENNATLITNLSVAQDFIDRLQAAKL
ncbi:MAG: argininosuccinate synthase [Candidatus Woykebacteria bacterium]